MTSRVQKGGPIFRPVVKSRVRPPTAAGDNRQLSVSTESASESRHASTPAPSSCSMPPPATVSNSMTPHPENPSGGGTNREILIHPHTRETPQPDPELLAPTSLPGRPPTLALANPSAKLRTTPHTGAPKATAPQPPSVMSTRSGIPLSFHSLPPVLASSSLSSESRNEDVSEPVPRFTSPHPSLRPQVLHHSGVENVPKLTTNASGLLKPSRTASKRKSAAEVPNGNQEEGSGTAKKVRPRKTQYESHAEPSGGQRTRKKKNPDGEDSNDESLDARVKRRRRSSSGTPRPRRSRGPSLPPFDPDADPGEEIDPTVVTMASLCSDTGQGRVSRKAAEILSNHVAWKAQNREKRARMKVLMELKKYGREEAGDVDTDEPPIQKEPTETPVAGPSGLTVQPSPLVPDDSHGFDYTQDLSTSRFNVQVRIGPNGETIIDEESLVVDRTETDDTQNYTHVVESDHTKFVNSGSYGKRFRGSRWSAEETEMFYDALSQYGENYELIAYVLPGRDRKSCKNKFKAEDKKNPARINYCLSNSIPVDMNTLSRMTGKDFSGPVPEIRAPTPHVEVNIAVPTESRESPPPDLHKKKRQKNKASNDDSVVIVGAADSFVPFPESP